MSKTRYETLFSREECETVLLRHFGNKSFNLVKHTLRPLSEEVVGFLGEHLWLEAEVETGGKIILLKFFAKFQPKSDVMWEFCHQSNAFGNEMCFFETIIPEFKKYNINLIEEIVPKYYFSKQNLVVLEDLTDKKFQTVESDDVLPITHIELVLKKVAKLHASTIIYEEKKSEELGRKYRLIDDFSEYLQETFFQRDENLVGYKWAHASMNGNLKIIDLMDAKINRTDFKKKYRKLVDDCFEISQPSREFRNVLCHADLWRNNMMFAYGEHHPIDCKFIDFQLMKYSPPAYDILKFMYQVTSAETRKHHFDDFIDQYYQHLCMELIKFQLNPEQVYPKHQFDASLKYLLGYTKIEASFYYHFQRVGPEFLKKVLSDLNTFHKFMLEDRSIAIDQFYHKGTYFQIWMDEILLEIHDSLTHDLSTEDCRTIIKNKLNSTNYELIDYSIKTLGEANGFLGCHRKIQTIISLNKHEVVLKFFGKFLPKSKLDVFAVSSGAFDNEVFMYETVFKKMNQLKINIFDCVPKCFFTRRNDVLVFNDLQELGYKMIDKHKALNYEHVSVIISSLAKYHACCFIMEEKSHIRLEEVFSSQLRDIAYNDENDITSKTIIQGLIYGVHTQIDLFPDSQAKIPDSELKKMAEKIYSKKMYEFSQPSKKFRNVICHGDLWSSNIMIKYDDSNRPLQAKLVDFQCVKKCPPAQDLMAFIYLTTSRKFRSNYMNDVLDFYYRELDRNLAEYDCSVDKILPYKDYLMSCEYYKVFAIAQTVSHFHLIMTPSNDMAALFDDDELMEKTFSVDRSDFIREMCSKNPKYRLMQIESLKDFRIMCETLLL